MTSDSAQPNHNDERIGDFFLRLDAEKLNAANQRIAKRYRIAQFQKLK